jgi:adenylate kinase
MQTTLLFGGPGAGKGTQGELLNAIPGFFHFSTGDAFRALDPNSNLANNVKQFSSRGELVPDDTTLSVLKNGLDRKADEGFYDPDRDLLVLDGYPRNPNQAKLLNSSMDVIAVVHLQCDDPTVLINRLKKRALEQDRADDAQDSVINRRLEIYHQETEPVLSTYDPSILHTVNTVGTPAQVLCGVLQVFAPLQAELFGNVLV